METPKSSNLQIGNKIVHRKDGVQFLLISPNHPMNPSIKPPYHPMNTPTKPLSPYEHPYQTPIKDGVQLLLPERGQGPQSPLWQTSSHVWCPHACSLPHTASHDHGGDAHLISCVCWPVIES